MAFLVFSTYVRKSTYIDSITVRMSQSFLQLNQTALNMQTPKVPDSDSTTKATLLVFQKGVKIFHNKLGELFLYGAGCLHGDINMFKREWDKKTKV